MLACVESGWPTDAKRISERADTSTVKIKSRSASSTPLCTNVACTTPESEKLESEETSAAGGGRERSFASRRERSCCNGSDVPHTRVTAETRPLRFYGWYFWFGEEWF